MKGDNIVVLRTSVGRTYSKKVEVNDDTSANLEVYVKRLQKVIVSDGERRSAGRSYSIKKRRPETSCCIQPTTYNDIACLKIQLHHILVGQLGLKLGDNDIVNLAKSFNGMMLHNSNDNREVMRTVVVAKFLNEEEVYITRQNSDGEKVDDQRVEATMPIQS